MKLSIELSKETARHRWEVLVHLCATLNASSDSAFIYENDDTIVEFRPENGTIKETYLNVSEAQLNKSGTYNIETYEKERIK